MMNNKTIYKRVKINWWIIIMLGVTYIFTIFAYIYQWGDNPVDLAALMKLSLILIFIFIFLGRFKVIIDDNFAVFRSDIWVPVRIPISKIEKVSVKKVDLMKVNIPGRKVVKYQFDFASQAVSIELKSGKVYNIDIKDAEKIKEEIEKRILAFNNYK